MPRKRAVAAEARTMSVDLISIFMHKVVESGRFRCRSPCSCYRLSGIKPFEFQRHEVFDEYITDNPATGVMIRNDVRFTQEVRGIHGSSEETTRRKLMATASNMWIHLPQSFRA